MRNQKVAYSSLISLLFLLFVCQSSQAQTKVWSGNGDSITWTDAGNWNPVGVPGAADSVEIPSVSGGVTITIDEDVEIDYLKARFSTNTLSFENSARLELNVMVEHGTTLNGNGFVVVRDSLEWVYGDIDLQVTVQEGAIARITDNTKWLRSNGRLVLNGTTIWEEGDILFSNDSEVINNGHFEKNGSGTSRTSGTINETPRFFNNGSLKFSTGATLRANLINSGETVVGSTLTLNSGSESDGQFIVEQGGLLNFNGGSHELGEAEFSGGGTVEFGSGSIVLNGTYNLDPETGITHFTGGMLTFSAGMDLVSFGSKLEISGANTSHQVNLNRSPVNTIPFLHKLNPSRVVLGDGVNLSVDRYDMFGGLVTGTGSILVNESMDWRIGTIQVDMTINEDADMLFSFESANIGSSKFAGPGNTITLLGNTEWEGGQIVLREETTIINHGTFIVNGPIGNGFSASGDIQMERRFENHGLFHLQASSSNLSLRRIQWNNYGVLRLEKELNLVAGLGGFKTNVINMDGARIEGTGSVRVRGGGAGQLPATFDNFGTIAPGLPLGQLSWRGLYSSSVGSVLEIELGGDTPGETSDILSSVSRVELDGEIDVKLANGFTPEVGQTFRIMEYSTASGDFRAIRSPAGFTFKTNYVNDMTENTGYIELEVLKAVENPIETLQFTHSTVEHLGHSVAMGDFNRDGFDDLAIVGLKRLQANKDVNNPDFYTGLAEDYITDLEVDTVFVLFNANSIASNQPVDLAEAADIKIATRPSSAVSFGGGNGMLHTADLDGDGYDELLVGGLVSETLVNAGGVYIFDFSDIPGFSGLNETHASTLRASDAGETYPERILADDVTHNGSIDILAGFPEASVGADRTGLVAVWERQDNGYPENPGLLTTNVPGSRLGMWLDSGDLDGDGNADLAVIAGGEIIEDLQFRRDLECTSRQENPLDVDFYDRLIEESNPGTAFLSYGPFVGGDISSSADVTVNGQFRNDPNTKLYSWHYAPFRRTYIHEAAEGDPARWYISESMPRTTLLQNLITRVLLKEEEVCEDKFDQLRLFHWNVVAAKSAIHMFMPDQLSPGSTLNEIDSATSFGDAGRSMIGAKMRENSSQNDFVFSGDIGEVKVQLTDRLQVYVINPFPEGLENLEVSRSYSYDISLGTEDTRSVQEFLTDNPLSLESISGFGQSIAAGRMGTDSIDEIIVGAPYYMPETPGSAMGKVYLFRSDSQVSPPVSDLLDDFDGLGQWQFLSSYTDGQTFASYLSDVWTQGAQNSSDPGGIPNIFTWDEAEAQFTAQFDLSEEMAAGRGFMAFLFEDDDRATPEIDGGFPKNFNPEGSPASGDFQFDLSFNGSTNSQLRGFNLLANPYAEPIDWDNPEAWTKTGVNDAIYVWDPEVNSGNGAYLQRAGGVGDPISQLEPLQGFFVQAASSDAELIVSETAVVQKETNRAADSDDPAVLSMSLSSENFEDRAYLVFRDDASEEPDENDAYKLDPISKERMIFYSVTPEGHPLAINSMPNSAEPEIDVPFTLESTRSGTATITWSMNHIPDDWTVILVDQQTGDRTDVSVENDYVFELDDNVQTNSRGKSTRTFSELKLANPQAEPRFILEIKFGEVVSIETNNELPAAFSMDQNYPNPFNPATTIRYGLPEQSNVRIEVFNMLGQIVQTVVDEHKRAGYHTVRIDASGLSSGLYIYRIRAGEFQETRKMTLIK